MHQRLGQSVGPVQQDDDPALSQQAGRLLLDQPRRPLEVLGRQGVADRLVHQPLLLVPPAGPAVQLRDAARLLRFQTTAQALREQVVVAIPAPLLVERRHEQVGAFHPHQDRGAVAVAR